MNHSRSSSTDATTVATDPDSTTQNSPAHSSPDSSSAAAVLAIVLSCYLLIIVDISIVITGLPEIQQDLGFSSTTLSWVQNIYTLAFGSLLLLGARSGDLLGRRRMLMIGLTLFALSSLVIGMASSPAMMLIGRAVQGAGAAILAPATLALLSVYFPEGPQRVKALAWYAATAGIGSSLGLVLGGLLAGWLSWRVGFFINAPFGLLLILAAWKVLDETDTHDGTFDLGGAVTSTLGMSALVFAIVHSSTAGWGDIYTLIALTAALLLLSLFVVIEANHHHPLLPLRLFESSERVVAYLARMLFLGSMVSFLFFSTQFMQGVLDFTPVEAGFAFLPFTVLTFVASTQVPRLTRRFGNSQVALMACVVLAIGMGWLALLDEHSDYWSGLALPMLLIGLGNGAVLGPLTIAGVSGVNKQDAGAASGVVNVAHQLGGTLGLSILVVVFAAAGSGLPDGHHKLAHQLAAGLDGSFVMLIVAAVLLFGFKRASLTTQNKRG
ncbi:MFS transporter [Oceanobacter kriegii]|uniref:MFS transporter n=1 Tax=Oceanobacter kriegii TaxID=64972 RepID=UPI000409ED91|nr:MFS transporter [Oceanobacter kriegii]